MEEDTRAIGINFWICTDVLHTLGLRQHSIHEFMISTLSQQAAREVRETPREELSGSLPRWR